MSLPMPSGPSSLESRVALLERVRRAGWWAGSVGLALVLLVVAVGAAVHAGPDRLVLWTLLVAALLAPVAFVAVAVLDA